MYRINRIINWHTSINKFNSIIDKFVGEYTYLHDGIPLKDLLADFDLSAEQLKSIIGELTEIKNTMETDDGSDGPINVVKHIDFELNEDKMYDVKMWLAPESAVDPKLYEPAEGTTSGEEGYYWALNLNFIGAEDLVYTFTDNSNREFNHHNDFSIDIDGADLKSDVRPHVENTNTEEEYHIDSRDIIVDGEFYKDEDGTFTYQPNDPNLELISSNNPDDFKAYVNPDAIRQYFKDVENVMPHSKIKYWEQYSDSTSAQFNSVEEALEEGLADWNNNADEKIESLDEDVVKEIKSFFDSAGYIDGDIVAAMIAQL